MTEKEQVRHLMQWKNGNGSPGAEARIQTIERKLGDCVDKDEVSAIRKQLRYLTIAITILAVASGPEALESIIQMIGRFL